MKKERIAVYIDGGNTYKRLKETNLFTGNKRFDYTSIVKYLVGDRELVSKRYYVGIVRNINKTFKEDKMVKSQQRFLGALSEEGFEIKKGKIMYDAGKIREKGVDVKMSLDLAVGASDDLYDTAIVMSSDTDIIPAIKYVVNGKHKKVEYVGFGINPSLGMINESTISRVFSSIDLAQFLKEK
jgi:uncharacterized LabA/DUF88 family protein